MKRLTYISATLLLATLSACDSSDSTPIQHPDGYELINFSAKTEEVMTRTNPYEAYSPEKHPLTMGVFGCYNGNIANNIFYNTTETYDPTTKNWTDMERKRWDDYKGVSSYDFLAYMPKTDGATVIMQTDGEYLLSVPVTLGNNSPFVFSTKEAPIICATPERKVATTAEGKELTFERVVNLQFDQTLIGYRLLFMLDSKMGAIRQFRIKNVSLSGKIAMGGTLQRSYTMKNGSWTASDIVWTDLQHTATSDAPFSLPYKESTDADADNTSKSLSINTNDYKQWGKTFYIIPDQSFQPVISVTYDVEMTAQDGSTIITRKNVTSNITLNKSNFSALANAKTAMVYPIRILIQPRYLYVLADQDAYTGYLLID